MLSWYFYNSFTINFKLRIIIGYCSWEKNNFNSEFKLELVITYHIGTLHFSLKIDDPMTHYIIATSATQDLLKNITKNFKY